MRIPKAIEDQLKIYCEGEELALAQIAIGEQLTVIIIGDPKIHPNEASIIISHALLEGIITGQWNQSQEEEIDNTLVTMPMKES